jgi:peptidoglycan/LPS O-acetylase OafA/YrhL
MQTPATTYRPDIDGLRAIAILPVIFFHAFPMSITGGFIGVDVFFVISGYLITSIIAEEIARGNFSYGSFYSRRVRRLFPTLLVVLVSTIVIGWNMLSAQEYKQLARHVLAGLSFMANINSWSEAGYFDAAADSKPLLHLWSLGVEEQFYIVWPTVATLLLPLFNKSRRTIFFTLAILIATAAMISGWSNEAAFYLPFSRFWELFCGAAIFVAIPRLSAACVDKADEIGACFGLLLILVPAYFLTSSSSFPWPWAVAPVAGASILIVTQGSFINRVVLSNRILVGVGLISYSLYLWHWPLLSFLHIEYSGTATNWMRALALVIAFVLATASYWLLEKPFRSKSRHPLKLLILGVTAVLTGIIAANIYARDGLGFRVDSIISQVIGEKDSQTGMAWR